MSDDEARLTQLAENMRFYGDMRFKQMTLLLGGFTLLAAGVAQAPVVDLPGQLTVRGLLAIGGMFFVGVMWVMEVRSTMNFFTTRKEAREFWPMAEFGWTRWLSATNAVAGLHAVLYGFWFWCCLYWEPRPLAIWVSAVAGLFLLSFTIDQYRRIRGLRE